MHNIKQMESIKRKQKLLFRIKTAIISGCMNQVREFRTVFEKRNSQNNVKYKKYISFDEIMNIEEQSPMTVTTEQATIQVRVVSEDNVMNFQGIDTPDNNCSKRTMDITNVHGKMRIRSPECGIKYLEHLSETFIEGHCQMCHGQHLFASAGVAAGLRYQ